MNLLITLMGLIKNNFAGLVENLAKLLNNNIEPCKSAAEGMGKLRSEQFQSD